LYTTIVHSHKHTQMSSSYWRWWVWLLLAYGLPTGELTARVVWPGLKVGGCLALFHIHHMNRVNSRSGFSYDDSTINIIILIIIIIIIIIILGPAGLDCLGFLSVLHVFLNYEPTLFL